MAITLSVAKFPFISQSGLSVNVAFLPTGQMWTREKLDHVETITVETRMICEKNT